MAYDSTRGVIVVFGGSNSNFTLGDTWEWNGIDWTQRSPASSPSVRPSFGQSVRTMVSKRAGAVLKVAISGDLHHYPRHQLAGDRGE